MKSPAGYLMWFVADIGDGRQVDTAIRCFFKDNISVEDAFAQGVETFMEDYVPPPGAKDIEVICAGLQQHHDPSSVDLDQWRTNIKNETSPEKLNELTWFRLDAGVVARGSWEDFFDVKGE